MAKYIIEWIECKIKKVSENIEYLHVDREGIEPPTHGFSDPPCTKFLSNSKRIQHLLHHLIYIC
jgi:hypothetical protein